MRWISSAPSIPLIRALPCALSVWMGICQPCQDRASTPISCSAIASSPVVTCSPVATTVSYSRASCKGDSAWHHADELVRHAGHGRNDDGHLIPGIDLALDAGRDVTDPVEVGHRGAAEFHHEAHGPGIASFSLWRRARILGAEQAGNMADPAVSPAEIARFDALAQEWWNPNGPMRALHRMNGPRVDWIASQAARAFPARSGLRLLDVGCGAGIAAEALARRGFEVLGIDPAGETIAAARAHAAGKGLPLDYSDWDDRSAEHRGGAVSDHHRT